MRNTRTNFALLYRFFQQGKLYTKFSKCKFWLSKVVFLGHMFNRKEIAMDRRKLRLSLNGHMIDGLRPKARSFSKLAGHYHRVVEGFSRLALPLTKLTRKDEKLYGSKSERRSLKNDIPAEDLATTRKVYTTSIVRPIKLQQIILIFLKLSSLQSGAGRLVSRTSFVSSDHSKFSTAFHKYHSFHDISYPHDQIHEDLSHLNEPEAILNCQDRCDVGVLSFYSSFSLRLGPGVISFEQKVKMDDPNITMEEYIMLEEEKARRRVFNDTLTSEASLYVLTPWQVLLTMMKLTLEYRLTNSTMKIARTHFKPQHIDEFNLKDETSFSKCDEEEQNILNFNDLFPFNVIYLNDSISDKDNDEDKVDIEHSSGDLFVKQLPDVINTDVGAYA
ncbi:hypothetical protein Tco_0604444 [Tanacetum coccineum]